MKSAAYEKVHFIIEEGEDYMKPAKILIAAGLLTVLLTACGADSSIEGRWEIPGRGDETSTSDLVKLEFFDDGTYVSNRSNYAGSYSVDGDRLRLEGIMVEPVAVTFEVNGDSLTFYNDDGEILYEYQRIE